MTALTTTPERPVPIPPHVEDIPTDLQDLPNFVIWRYRFDADEGKWTKALKDVHRPEHNASSTNPSTWTRFGEAVALMQRGQWDGIAVALVPPFVGIDLDKCRDAQTGSIEAWAQAIIERMASYVEVSPSGTGVHIIVRGSLPVGGRRKAGHIEMYDRARFLTLTGVQP